MQSALSQSEEISSDFCCFYGGGIRHNEDIMHSFQNFIVRLIPNHPSPSRNKDMEISCESAACNAVPNMQYAVCRDAMPYPVMQYAVCRDTICRIREQYAVSGDAICRIREQYAVSGDAICRIR